MRLVEGDGAPLVRISPDLNETAKLLGQIATRLDIFKLSGELVFFDDGLMRVMTGRIFRTWINDHVVMATKFAADGSAVRGTLEVTDAATILDSPNFRRGVRELRGVEHVRLPVLRRMPNAEARMTNEQPKAPDRRSGSGDPRSQGKAPNGDGAVGASCPTFVLDVLPWGYDAETCVYTVDPGWDYDRDVAWEAGKVGLDRIDAEFPFSDERSRSVQRAGELALFCKHLPDGLSLRPGFLWLGNKAGSGKSILAKKALYPVLGKAIPAKLKRGEELDKEMEAFLRARRPYVFLDNVYGGIASSTLDQMLTSKGSAGRAMGGHEVFEADNTALLLVSGNGLELNPDAARRFSVVDLFEKGDPNDRRPKERLDDDVMLTVEWRRKMLGYLFSLVARWVEVGMPRGKVVIPSFERFCELMGGIVTCAGYEEPFQPAVIPDAISPEKEDFSELLDLVLGEMGSEIEREFTLDDLARLARSAGLYTEQVGTLAEGKRLTVKLDGLKGELASIAEDCGYLEPKHRSAFGKKMAKHVGQEPRAKCGRTVEFGKRTQGRKATFTIRVIG